MNEQLYNDIVKTAQVLEDTQAFAAHDTIITGSIAIQWEESTNFALDNTVAVTGWIILKEYRTNLLEERAFDLLLWVSILERFLRVFS